MSTRPAALLLKPAAAPAAPARRTWLAALGVAACAASGLLALGLAVRPVETVDLGYHLAYGERFLDTGRIVRDDSFIYPAITPTGVKPDELPPGAWFDAQGHYHFLNANWLTQIILALLWRLGGWGAMDATMIALVAIIMVAQAAALRRLGQPNVAQPPPAARLANVAQPPSAVLAEHPRLFWPAWLAAVWLATGVIGHERFMLRPELFSFACLAVQLWLLAGEITWRRIIAFAAVQLLAVNLHSYWLLGVGLVGALWADAAARWAWAKWITLKPLDGATRQRLIRLCVGLAATVPAAMLHPDGPPNALFPIQTLSYLKKTGVSGIDKQQLNAEWHEGKLHPWATIGEFNRPLVAGSWSVRSNEALLALLAAGAVAAAALAWRRQWGQVLLLGGLAAVSLSMQRNIVIFAFVASPIVIAALAQAWLALRARLAAPAGEDSRLRGKSAARVDASAPAGSGRPHWWMIALPAAASAILLGLGLWWLVNLSTNRFYYSERKIWSLGFGASHMSIPLGPCRWLDEHLPTAQPVFTDQPNSSSVVYFCQKATIMDHGTPRGVPVLTNTWAMPASRFDTILRMGDGRLGLEPLDQWGFNAAVIRVWPNTRELVMKLLASSEPVLKLPITQQWALVYAETSFMVFIRRSAATPEMLQHEITPATLDADTFADLCGRQHPVRASAIKDGAVMLQNVDEALTPFRVGWQEKARLDPNVPALTRADWLVPAERLWRICLATPPGDTFYEAWLNLGVCLAHESIRLRFAGEPIAALIKLREARDCFAHALKLKSDFGKARRDLEVAEADLRQYGGLTGTENKK